MAPLLEKLLIFIQILIFLGLINFALAALSLAPYVATRKRDIERVIKLADLKGGEVFYELGCGDGRVLFEVAKRYDVKAIGVEIALPLYLLCQLKRLFFKKRKNVVIKFKDVFKEDLSQANVIYFFGMPKPIREKLKAKFEKELKPKTKVISYVFQIEGWKEKAISKPEKEVPIFLYEIE